MMVMVMMINDGDDDDGDDVDDCGVFQLGIHDHPEKTMINAFIT